MASPSSISQNSTLPFSPNTTAAPTIALLPLARTTFDIPLAQEVVQQVREALSAAGLELTGPQDLITDLRATEAAAQSLAGQPVDLLLVLQATFADSSMVVTLANASDAPLFLWAVPEARTGGRLRLNSLCGINLAGHALSLRDRDYEYAYAPPDDTETLAQVRALAAAGRLKRQLQQARLGVVGEHPAGFDSCHLDASQLNHLFGVQVVNIELPQVFERARAVPQQQLAQVRSGLDQRLDNLDQLDQGPLQGTLSVYSALKDMANTQQLDGLAVRCWPEFFTEMGCAACGAMSMLSDEQLPCSCEADANGTITQMLLQWLSGEPAFGSDLVAVDYDEDVAVLWHCGLAPLSMADPDYQPHGGIHSNRKVPLVMEFPLKPGPVTVARLGQTRDGLRLVVGRGEMIASKPSFSGTSGVLRFERPARQVLDTILGEGLEHHVSLVYGDYRAELLAFAKLIQLPVLHL